MLLYKICDEAEWREAERDGTYRGAPVDLADGFVHLSTAAQVRETAARHFAGRAGLLLVAVPADTLGEALRWEPSRGGDLFPHLYGPLRVADAASVVPLPLGPDGRHAFPPGLDDLPPFDPAAAGWRRRDGDDFVGLVGPFWTPPDETPGHYGFLAERRHLNRGGVVHGGMVMTFADQALGMTSWAATGGRRQVTIQLDTQFVSGARAGEFVEARCRVVRRTAALVFLAAELAVGDRVVASATGIWKLRAAKNPGQ